MRRPPPVLVRIKCLYHFLGRCRGAGSPHVQPRRRLTGDGGARECAEPYPAEPYPAAGPSSLGGVGAGGDTGAIPSSAPGLRGEGPDGRAGGSGGAAHLREA